VLETNQDLVGVIRLLQCEHYKTYRIYQRDLAAT